MLLRSDKDYTLFYTHKYADDIIQKLSNFVNGINHMKVVRYCKAHIVMDMETLEVLSSDYYPLFLYNVVSFCSILIYNI